MLIVAQVLAALAALIHVYFFVLESIRWTQASRQVFGLSAEDAETVRVFAFNQGFYNLFLAIGAGVGVGLVESNHDAGAALLILSLGSMIGAAIVLIASTGNKQGALIQGLIPAVSLAVFALAH